MLFRSSLPEYNGTMASLTNKELGRRSSQAFHGIMDEVMIYNDTLTQDEIRQLYKAGLSLHAVTNITLETRTADSYNLTDPSLSALWGFNADDNGTDATGVNNGTCTNCPTWSAENGTVGGGYNFDGTDDIINTTDPYGILIRDSRKHFKIINCDIISANVYGIALYNINGSFYSTR